jgi:Zn-dependent peptidase ImmA (M78 family)
VDWKLAHRIAGIAANQALRDLSIDRDSYVPVYDALVAAGVVGMAQPMPRLFGVYYSPQDNGPAILLNAGLDVINQRHTAAHELGHHLLRHSTAADNELNSPARWGDGRWPDHEKLAEAFAAWFLMPMPAVLKALSRVGGKSSPRPVHAYLVARALGTSYVGTVRQLSNLRLITRGQMEQWASIPPARHKQELAGRPVPGKPQVHAVLPSMHGLTLHVDVGDLIAPQAPDTRFVDPPTAVRHWPDLAPPGAQLMEITDELVEGTPITLWLEPGNDLDGSFRVQLARESPRRGVHEVWP